MEERKWLCIHTWDSEWGNEEDGEYAHVGFRHQSVCVIWVMEREREEEEDEEENKVFDSREGCDCV